MPDRCAYTGITGCGGPADAALTLRHHDGVEMALACYHHIMEVMFQLAGKHGMAEPPTELIIMPLNWNAPWGT